MKISADHLRKLEAFARRLRMNGKESGSTNLGPTHYQIRLNGATTEFTVLAVNGKPLEEEQT